MTHTPTRLDVIAEAGALAETIEHSRWSNRLAYLWAVTFVLLVMLAGAIWFDKPRTVIDTLAWMIVFAATLLVVTPSAEQMTKMLAQVAAIRAGARVS